MQLEIVPGGNGEVAKRYMETPCAHAFHEDCLEGWMNYKKQCPVCRSALPPLID